MASGMIHIAVAKKVNEVLKMDENLLYLGTLAPDISSILKRKKSRSHFYTNKDVPDLNKYILKYKKEMSRPIEMGYYIHLYVDQLWDELITKDIIDINCITLLNGTKIKIKEKDAKKLLNKDFSNINENIINKYKIDLSLFDKSIRVPKIYINEIPVKKVKLVIDDMNKILSESKKEKTVIIDEKNVYKFINNASKAIIDNLKELEFII